MATKEIQYLIEKFGGEDKVLIPRTREGFYPVLASLGYKIGVEIGVYEAANASQIMMNCPDMKLFLVDPYKKRYFSRKMNRTTTVKDVLHIAKKRLSNIAETVPIKYKFIRRTSMEAVRRFEDASLDFVYIDGNHSYEAVTEDLEAWSPKVRKGGMIGGHDYKEKGVRRVKRVVRAVDDFVRKNKIKPFYVTWEKYPSFFFINE